MNESGTQHCDQCKTENKIISMSYLQNIDLHICIYCLRNGYQKLLEFVKEAHLAELLIKNFVKEKSLDLKGTSLCMRATKLLKEIGEL